MSKKSKPGDGTSGKGTKGGGQTLIFFGVPAFASFFGKIFSFFKRF